MKYVVIEVIDHYPTGDIVREIPFIFPASIVHSEMEMSIHRMLRRERADGRLRELNTVSAGFLSSFEFTGNCYGDSKSIGVGSRGMEDTLLIQSIDYTHGVK